MNAVRTHRAAVAAFVTIAIGSAAAAQTCFEVDPPIASGGDQPIRAELGDFDADGDLDVGVYNSISYTLATSRNDGDGTWTAPVTILTNWDTRDHDFLDVDGDGRADLV